MPEYTTNFSLPKYSLTDVPDLTASYNSAMDIIDANLKNAGGEQVSGAPIMHASADTTYGLGNAANYGHVKLTDSVSTSDASGGVAATPKMVNDAKSVAETAQSAAETAQSTATAAQSAAETAQSAAETAQSTADAAQSTATAAQSAADAAQSTATAAQSAAETAQSAAETAQSTATAAQSAAETAQSAAETAQNTATAAQSGKPVITDTFKADGAMTVGTTDDVTCTFATITPENLNEYTWMSVRVIGYNKSTGKKSIITFPIKPAKDLAFLGFLVTVPVQYNSNPYYGVVILNVQLTDTQITFHYTFSANGNIDGGQKLFFTDCWIY